VSDDAEEAAAAPAPASRRRWLRPLLVVVLFAGSWAVGEATGVTDHLTQDGIRALVAEAGVWGALVYVAVFTIGELVHVPGIVFVAAAAVAFGGVHGFLLALAAAVVSVSTSFFVVRAVGGRALTTVERPWVVKMLARLDARPIRTIAILRLVLWLAPPLNYALAMTSVSFRDYLIGSVLGLGPPVLAMYLLFDVIF
jgi:uncharacterized membrane protein YdjX (TVP38/TMEM64 family)